MVCYFNSDHSQNRFRLMYHVQTATGQTITLQEKYIFIYLKNKIMTSFCTGDSNAWTISHPQEKLKRFHNSVLFVLELHQFPAANKNCKNKNTIRTNRIFEVDLHLYK